MHRTQEFFLHWSYWVGISLSDLSSSISCWSLLFFPLFLQICIAKILRFLQSLSQVAAKQFFDFSQARSCHFSFASELDVKLEIFVTLFIAGCLLQRLHSEQLLLVKVFFVSVLDFFDWRQYFLRFGVDKLRIDYFDFSLENEEYCVLLFLVGIYDRFAFLTSRNYEAIKQSAGKALWEFLKERLLFEDVLQLISNQHYLQALSKGFLDISYTNRDDMWVFFSYQSVSPYSFII